MYLCRHAFQHVGVNAADTAVFAMRNPPASSRKIVIQRTVLTLGFNGTSAAVDVGHAMARFATANPTGGTSPVRIKLNNNAADSVIADANVKHGAALSMAGATFEEYFHTIIIPATAGSVLTHFIDWQPPYFTLLPGEGLMIRVFIITVAGTTISGSIWWDEKGI